MKRFPRLHFAVAMLIAFIISLVVPPAHGQALRTSTAFTGIQATAASAATTSPTNSTIALRKDRGIALWVVQSCTNTLSTATITYNFVPGYTPSSGDNSVTNWATSVIPFAVALSGTNVLRAYTNIPPSYLNNASHLKLLSIVNAGTSTTNDATLGGVTATFWYPSDTN